MHRTLYPTTIALLATVHLGATQFTIDEAHSLVTLSGESGGYAIQAQGTGAFTSHLSGTLNATLTGTSIQFSGGSRILIVTNGAWAPGPGWTIGSAPADFGALANVGGATAKVALRNMALDVTSPALPLGQGLFQASAASVWFPTNAPPTVDYLASPQIQGEVSSPPSGYPRAQ